MGFSKEVIDDMEQQILNKKMFYRADRKGAIKKLIQSLPDWHWQTPEGEYLEQELKKLEKRP